MCSDENLHDYACVLSSVVPLDPVNAVYGAFTVVKLIQSASAYLSLKHIGSTDEARPDCNLDPSDLVDCYSLLRRHGSRSHLARASHHEYSDIYQPCKVYQSSLTGFVCFEHSQSEVTYHF